MSALLSVEELDVKYGAVQVLFGVNMEIAEGEIVALLGTNGAGKSTLLSAISGLLKPAGGSIAFAGQSIGGRAAHKVVAEGIVLAPGGKGVFPTLSVEENLSLAGWLLADQPELFEERKNEVLEHFPRLRERWHEKAGDLSGGEQQMLTLGQAFITQPRLLMIDELSLGLAPVIVEQLLEIVKAIHETGTTIILVEQSVNVAVTVADRAVFMEKGEVRFDGATHELLDRPDILRAVFLGDAAKNLSESGNGDKASDRSLDSGPVVLETRGIEVNYGGVRAVNDVDLTLRAGEIMGVIGPNGAGKTTLFDAISGFAPSTDGRVVLCGEDVTELGPDRRAWAGLGRSFQDARLFPALTVAENLAVALERHIPTRDTVAAAVASPATKISERWVRYRVDELIDLMNLEAFANKFIHELSTGTRRVVDLAASLGHQPSVLLLDEPSSGIAQREAEALGPLLKHIRDQTGAGMIVIEHDVALLTSVADSMLALELGTVIAFGTPHEVITNDRVVESYLGEAMEVIKRSGDEASPELDAAELEPVAAAIPGPPSPRPRRRRQAALAAPATPGPLPVPPEQSAARELQARPSRPPRKIPVKKVARPIRRDR